MARSDEDSWDLTTSVGATATAVAASRALATRAGVIDDPWAEPLVRAVGMTHFTDILDGRTDADSQVERLAAGMALRTRYIAEGLLMYLPPEAQDRLFDHITALSPTGSRLATEFFPSMDAFTSDDGQWQRYGFNDDLAGLVYTGERNHVIDYLHGLGWTVTGSAVRELFETYGIEHGDDAMSAQFDGFQYISARLAS